MITYNKLINSVYFQSFEDGHLKEMLKSYWEANWDIIIDNKPLISRNDFKAYNALETIKSEYLKEEMIKRLTHKGFLHFWDWIHED